MERRCTCPFDIPPEDPDEHEDGCPIRREWLERRRIA